MQLWPSGLRRCVQVAVSSDAWVQTPQVAYNNSNNNIYIAHLAQTVERWPFKPMVVGSIPTVGVLYIFFFYIKI